MKSSIVMPGNSSSMLRSASLRVPPRLAISFSCSSRIQASRPSFASSGMVDSASLITSSLFTNWSKAS